MKRLLPADLTNVVESMAPDLRDALVKANGRLFLCGGFIRDTILGDPPKDADVFGQDAAYIKEVGLTGGCGDRPKARATVYSISWASLIYGVSGPEHPPVQFVYTWPVSNAWTGIQRMDFTMCQAAVWYSRRKWRSVCTKEFYPDVQAKRLRYTHPEREGTAGRSLVRAMNFVARGWKFPAAELAALIAHTSHEVNTPEKKYTPRRRGILGDLFARNISGLYPIGSKKR